MQDIFLVIGDFFTNLFRNLINMDRWYLDIIDIALVAVLLYNAIKFVKETRAAQLLKGVLLLLIIYAVSSICRLTSISYILQYIFQKSNTRK